MYLDMGADNLTAGTMGFITGQDNPTILHQAIRGIGLSDTTARLVEFGVDLSPAVPGMLREAGSIAAKGGAMLRLYDMRTAKQMKSFTISASSSPAEIFVSSSKPRVTSNTSSNPSSSSNTASSFTERWTQELNKRGYQDHHVVSNKNQGTIDTVTEAFNRAGIELDSRTNKIFLPEKEGIHPTRSLHDGRHLKIVNDALKEKLKPIIKIGEQEGWNQAQYRKAVIEVINREKGLLKTGERTLNKNKTSNARAHSPVRSPSP